MIEELITPSNAEGPAAILSEGSSCVVGGYFSKWKMIKGRLSCVFPENSPDPEDRASADGGTRCGSGGMSCNPRVYGYAADNKRHCVALGPGLSGECRKAFTERYGDKPDLLKEDLSRLLKNPKEQQAYDELTGKLTAFEENLGKYEKENFIDPTQKVALDAAREPLKKVLETARANIKDPKAVEAAKTTAAAQFKAAAPPKLAAALKAAALPPQGATQAATATTAPASTAESPLLGRELSCIKNGLNAAGHDVSERYLALVGVGVQVGDGPYDTRDELQRQKLQERAITYISAYGFCDNASYPEVTTPGERSQIRRWLTADGGSIRSPDEPYLTKGSTGGSGKEPGQSKLKEIFGINDQGTFGARTDFSLLFQHRDTWNARALSERREPLNSSGRNNRSDQRWEKCRNSMNQRITNDPDFKASASKPSGQTACHAMIKACGLSTEACGGGAPAQQPAGGAPSNQPAVR